ncbi:chaplin [Streptomyces sp. NPDC018031]|uniref:chaplin n=1 Tax=Streptomyces sp. NPDC018031 TaxID=3365033 RepID=UPI00378C6DAD
MKNIKKLAATTIAAGGLVLAGAGVASAAGSTAHGDAVGSPGVVSGNVLQVPVKVSANVCGDSVDIIGLVNPAAGNACGNA